MYFERTKEIHTYFRAFRYSHIGVAIGSGRPGSNPSGRVAGRVAGRYLLLAGRVTGQNWLTRPDPSILNFKYIILDLCLHSWFKNNVIDKSQGTGHSLVFWIRACHWSTTNSSGLAEIMIWNQSKYPFLEQFNFSTLSGLKMVQCDESFWTIKCKSRFWKRTKPFGAKVEPFRTIN